MKIIKRYKFFSGSALQAYINSPSNAKFRDWIGSDREFFGWTDTANNTIGECLLPFKPAYTLDFCVIFTNSEMRFIKEIPLPSYPDAVVPRDMIAYRFRSDDLLKKYAVRYKTNILAAELIGNSEFVFHATPHRDGMIYEIYVHGKKFSPDDGTSIFSDIEIDEYLEVAEDKSEPVLESNFDELTKKELAILNQKAIMFADEIKSLNVKLAQVNNRIKELE
ncbi:MAG: hypothetical protein [Caudoviricetes sp.]|nr:MAG: hypothetical protein [Caudoviricetes sp.]